MFDRGHTPLAPPSCLQGVDSHVPSTGDARRSPSPRGAQRTIALVLPSAMASGTERRLSFVYRHLERRFPGEYRLVVSGDLYPVLNRGGYGLDRLPGVHVLGRRSALDVKGGSDASALVNLGRMLTLLRYRRDLRQMIARERVTLLHPYLELVPFLAMFPIREIPWVIPIVDHQPRYFDPRSPHCRLLLRATTSAERVDCLYRWVADKMEALGAARSKLCNPAWNCVNHDAFHPAEKDERLVTFAARTIDLKSPLLMMEIIDLVFRRVPEARFAVLGRGDRESTLAQQIARRGWENRVRVGYLEDPSPVVNASLVHLSLERFDNFANQSLLEGMAAGCATVASRVGETHRVVTEEIGLLAPLEAGPLADAVLTLLDDPARARQMGKAGRARVLANHHVDAYIDYLRLVHDLSRQGRVVDGVPMASQA